MRMGEEQGPWNIQQSPPPQPPTPPPPETKPPSQRNGNRFVYHTQKDPWLRAKNRPVSGSKPGQLFYGSPMPIEMLTAIDPLRAPLRPSSAISHAYVDMKRS